MRDNHIGADSPEVMLGFKKQFPIQHVKVFSNLGRPEHYGISITSYKEPGNINHLREILTKVAVPQLASTQHQDDFIQISVCEMFTETEATFDLTFNTRSKYFISVTSNEVGNTVADLIKAVEVYSLSCFLPVFPIFNQMGMQRIVFNYNEGVYEVASITDPQNPMPLPSIDASQSLFYWNTSWYDCISEN